MNEGTPESEELEFERLLSGAYQPEPIDPAFAQRTVARLQKLAQGRREGDHTHRRILWLVLANTLAVFALVLGVLLFHKLIGDQEKNRQEQKDKEKENGTPYEQTIPRPRQSSRTSSSL